ncbi:DUF3168 domain-containing protein [Brevundimonas sp.]|uniref:DUF3168 domain-containing protein n=1 Tax=Brevundimonas sp. TaxID=1871086 RepID=UPI0025C59174|nr:DUF3168 domain-containing protein [Brevundimonas sp.]
MEEAITRLLLNNLAVAALVTDRVNWGQRPGPEVPAVTLHRITGKRYATMTARSGLEASSVQIDCWGETYSQAKKLARAIIPALPHSRTVLGGVVLQGIFIDSENDSFEADASTPLFRTRIDISVWHKEAEE